MSWKDFLRTQRPLVTLVGALGARTFDEVVLKVAFAKAVLASLPPGAPVPWGPVLNILEDQELGLSESEAREALLRSGLVTTENGMLAVPDKIAAEGAFMERLPRGSVTLAREDFIELLDMDREEEGVTTASVDLGAGLGALDRTTRWGATIAMAALDAKLPGVPVFWTRQDDGRYEPFNSDPGTLNTSDTLRIVVERACLGAALPQLTGAEEDGCLRLWELLLHLQKRSGPWHPAHGWLRRRRPAWDTGAFSVPAWDDDFVGSYLDKYQTRGPCPSTDATGGALIALCAALASGLANRLAPRGRGALKRCTVAAVRAGAGFLLRAQLPDGGWPLYRFEGDRYPMPARDVSSWYAVGGLAEAAHGGLLMPNQGQLVKDAARRFLDLVRREVRCERDECSWMPNFVTPFARDPERLLATAITSLTLDAAARVWPDLAPDVRPMLSGAVAFVERIWEPNPEQYARIEFRVPTWDGPKDTRFPWEWPLDPLVVSMLLGAEAAGLVVNAGLQLRITRAVAGFLTHETYGHWNDFLMAKEGKQRAMVPNTVKYHRALLDYVARQRTLVDRFYGGTA